MLVGACKWQGAHTGVDQLQKLDRRVRLVGEDSATRRWLFAREGFTSGCTELARESDFVRLVDFAEMARERGDIAWS